MNIRRPEVDTALLWERACSRIRSDIQHLCWL